MQGTDLVAGRIAEVGKIGFPCGPFTPAGRVLDALAAVGDSDVVEGFDLLGIGACVIISVIVRLVILGIYGRLRCNSIPTFKRLVLLPGSPGNR